MRQAHKGMNPATAAALTTALVWSSILDAMLVRAHADSNCKSGLELKTMVSKKSGKQSNIWLTCSYDRGTLPSLVQY
jgi:hypothetical protein